MAFITAEKIHNGQQWLKQGTIVEIAEDGTILGLHEKGENQATYYAGILTPCFINVHCHLELSHLKGVVPEHTTLIPFLKSIPQYRNNFSEEEKKTARHAAYQELINNGIIAVGDIANTTDTIDIRAKNNLNFITFIETIGFLDSRADMAFQNAINTYHIFNEQIAQHQLLKQTIVPHAPYSVSPSLFKKIDQFQESQIISIHNQESEEENKFYINKTGGICDLLNAMNLDYTNFQPTGKNAIASYTHWISSSHPMIFVHNTYTTKEDIILVQNKYENIYWCLCPNANLYIENKLPDIEMISSLGRYICIGTDSLASNHQLSILSELNTIKNAYPNISWETLISWGTLNGAKALNMQDVVGTIETGKKPGILQITGLDNEETVAIVKRII